MGKLSWEVYAIVLIGEFQHNIDAKGRLTMPAKFRPELGGQFVVTRGLDGCLFGYPMENWAVQEEKLKKLNLMKKDKVKYVEISFDDKIGEISFAGKSNDWGIDWDVDYESIQALDYQDPEE